MAEGKEKKGFFKRLVSGLTKTRDNIVSGFDSIFSGFSHIDDDFYEELEEIKENQYMLYDAICQTNYMLSQIADDAAVAAYNTEVIVTNQRICQRYYMV